MFRKMSLALATMLAICGMLASPCLATYKIGALFSVTGPYSFLGGPEKKTAEMVAEDVNTAGGINGQKIELIVYDDEGDAAKCNLLARKLIQQDKVLAVIGPSVSGLSIAVIPIFERFKTPLISCSASYKIVSDDRNGGKPYPWVFKTAESDSLAVEAIYSHMQKHGIKKIAVMGDTSGYGASGREELTRLAPKYGITIVADEKYDPKDTDLTAQLTKIKSLNPQAIVNWSVGPTEVTVLRNRRDLGMTNIAFYESHGFGNQKNITLAAGAAEGVYCPLGACNIPNLLPANHPQKAVTMQYEKEYTAKYKEPLSSFGGHAWDAMYLLVDAIKHVGPDKAKIRTFIENTKGFVGQHGVFNFSPNDHNGLTKEAFTMVVVHNGTWALAD